MCLAPPPGRSGRGGARGGGKHAARTAQHAGGGSSHPEAVDQHPRLLATLKGFKEPVLCAPNDPDDARLLSEVMGDKIDEVLLLS